MDRCPAELHLKIFLFACTDGGRTGCALSLVSHHIHATSAPARFHTVVLHGVPRMRSFLSMLEAKTPSIAVRHLLLYDNGHEGRRDLGENPLAVVVSIISNVAPSLVTFAGSVRFITHEHGFSSVIPRVGRFPLLRDLSLRGTRGQTAGYEEEAMANLPHFPSLRRLHLWGGLAREDVVHFIRALITKCAPRLTDIRLSDAGQWTQIPYILETGLRVGTENSQPWFGRTQGENPVFQIPAGVEQLILQTAPSIGGFSGMMHEMLQADLLKLAEEQEKIIVAPNYHYEITDCITDWYDVIDGGDGCWRLPAILENVTVQEGL